MDSPPSILLRPMRIGAILDRALSLLPQLVWRVLIGYLLLAALYTLNQYLEFVTDWASNSENSVGLDFFEMGIATFAIFLFNFIVQICLQYYLQLIVVLTGAKLWLGETVDMKEIRARVTVAKMFELFVLGIVISITTVLYSVLLILPGIIYFINRIVAIYVLLLEEKSISESLKESKKLMTFHPDAKWYSFGTPMMRVSGIMLITFVLGVFPGVLTATSLELGTGVASGTEVALELVDVVLFYVSSLLTLIFSGYGSLAVLGFYYDLQVRYKGIDLSKRLERLAA